MTDGHGCQVPSSLGASPCVHMVSLFRGQGEKWVVAFLWLLLVPPMRIVFRKMSLDNASHKTTDFLTKSS